jgi:hypothetical protein
VCPRRFAVLSVLEASRAFSSTNRFPEGSQAKGRLEMTKKPSRIVARNYKPMNPQNASIQSLCIAEALYEEMKKRRGKGSDCGYITAEQVEAKVQEKERELKATGKVTTTVPPGMIGTADVNGEEVIILDEEFILMDPLGASEPTGRWH